MSTVTAEDQATDGSDGGPPKPRTVGGWADEKGKRKRDTFEEDERLRVTEGQDDDNDDLPVIPDLEAVQEEDLTTQIAAPPSLAVNRVATYKQLDSDLQRHTFTLGGDIDLKLLSKALSLETEVSEDDTVWEWEKLFAEVSSEIQSVWERGRGQTHPEPEDKTEPLPS